MRKMEQVTRYRCAWCGIPRPWRHEPSGRVGTDCIFDADGSYVATVSKLASPIICEAVNEYDRLRDIVRRLGEAVYVNRHAGSVSYDSKEIFDLAEEAREAIGEGK